MDEFVQVSTTAGSREDAARLARSAVQSRLAATAQVVGPVASFFWHEGELGEGEEWQVWLKTTAARYADLESHLIQNHPWQKPEVTAVPLVAGSLPYLDWVSKSVS